MTHLADLFERMRHYASRPCIESQSHSHTYEELLHEIERWSVRLDQERISPGCVVALRSDYSFSAISALFALFDRRAIVALIPRDQDIDRYLTDAHATALLSLDHEGNCQWRSLPSTESHPLLQRLRSTGEGGMIIFTSGSTGRSKAALQSLERFLQKLSRPGRSLRTLAFLLFDHIGGLDTLLYTLSNGGTLILGQRRDPESIVRSIEALKVEVLPTSPSFLRLLCGARCTDKYDLSSLKIITYGAEPMDDKTLSRINTLFPNAQIMQKYGTTELGSPRSISRGNDSLWLKIKGDGVETKVVDGVLWIRSEGAMLGYLNETSSLDEHGWYCTGDLVDVDGEWIQFRGRVKDIINVGGEKVSPIEIERLLLELDFVSQALVRGEPHALMGQVVTARVALTDASYDPAEAIKRIRLHCRAHLPMHKVPIRIDVVTERLENDRQKMVRHPASRVKDAR